MIKAVALSMALNLCCVMQLWVLSRGLGIVVSAWTLFAIVPMIISVSALPVTPSGLGVRESGFVLMLSAPSVDVNATAALSLAVAVASTASAGPAQTSATIDAATPGCRMRRMVA